MGEYIKHKGQSFKVGTCDDLYYTTYNSMLSADEANELENDGDGTGYDFLKSDSGYRFRFPFPEEDDIKFGEYPEDHNKGLFVKILRTSLSEEWGKDYEPVIQWHNVNNNPELRMKMTGENPNNYDTWIKLEIVQQKHIDGILMLIVRDPFTGNKCRIERHMIVEFIRAIVSHYIDPDTAMRGHDAAYYDKVCKRIMDGYKLPYMMWDDVVKCREELRIPDEG